VTIHIPPLRERREEIPVFLDFFLRKYSEFYGKTPAPFSDYAVGRMMEYSWPGNIRELENLVKRYTIVGNEPQIIRELSTHKPILRSEGQTNSPIWGIKQDPPPAMAAAAGGNGSAQQASQLPPTNSDGNGNGAVLDMEMPSLLEIGRRAAMQAERVAIERVLAQTRWNRRQAAKILKISYKALLNKLKAMEEQKQVQAKQSTA
jgi:two-component system response regulator AtoC